MTATDVPQARRTITDESIEALERRIGIPVRRTLHPHVVAVTEDSIRHFANGIGQDDPIYCDPDYGRTSPWGSVIAPPLYFTAIGIREPGRVDASAGRGHERRRSARGYRPVHDQGELDVLPADSARRHNHAATGPAPRGAQAIGDRRAHLAPGYASHDPPELGRLGLRRDRADCTTTRTATRTALAGLRKRRRWIRPLRC